MLLNYLSKNLLRPQLIKANADINLGLIVVIPAHDEESLIPTLESLAACNKSECTVEVIVVFNASEISDKEVTDRNVRSKCQLIKWYENQNDLKFKVYVLEENSLPKKYAGVGLARKIGMDEAVRRFEAVDNPKGIIACFDADSKCDTNYLVELENHFIKFTNSAACSIYFEHPTEGEEFTSDVYEGIYWYELHLRYYKNALAYAGFPFAFHTIGSSMAVMASAYCKEGGMNRRKAGEDFYFLQKFISNNELTELKTTKVIPSPRPSHRVPFGTGRAIQEMIDEEREIEKTYAFETFEIMRECFVDASNWFEKTPVFHKHLIAFYGEENLNKKINEIRRQSTDKNRFEKRLFQWFSAFQALKFAHFLRDENKGLQLLNTEVEKLLQKMNLKIDTDLLTLLRTLDRKVSDGS